MSDSMDAFLKHYGVKGMHWGVRRAGRGVQKAPSNFFKTVHEPNSADHDAVQEIRSKPASKLSNEQLKKINTRLQLEKTYAELSSNTKTVKKGKKTVDNILSTANKANQVYTLYNSPMVKAIKDHLATTTK